MVKRIPVFAFLIAAYGETRRDKRIGEGSHDPCEPCGAAETAARRRLRVAPEMSIEPVDDGEAARSVETADAK